MSNITGSGGSFSSGEEVDEQQQPPPPPMKKKRNLPGTPDPNAEVIALSPTTLMATNRFVCEICNKGFQRDQNLQLHRRGHNLPWKLRQRQPTSEVRKRVYVCPVKTCVHNNPSRALGDLTGIKKHYCRKHGEKKWKCDKCSKKYAVKSDWKAHSKTCGTKEYRCDCGTLFSRRDSFITHRAFCDALAEENKPTSLNVDSFMAGAAGFIMPPLTAGASAADSTHEKTNAPLMPISLGSLGVAGGSLFSTTSGALIGEPAREPSTLSPLQLSMSDSLGFNSVSKSDSSATALLQKAAQIGATASSAVIGGGFQAGVYDSRRSKLVGIGGSGGFFLGEAPGMFTTAAEAVYGGTGISCVDLTHARPVVMTGAAPWFGGGGDDVMTVNFLGRGAIDTRLHEQQQHQMGKVTWDV